MRYYTSHGPVHVSTQMTGKMAGIDTLSTSCLCNRICSKRGQNENSVCHFCFAKRTIRCYSKNLAPLLEENYRILNKGLLKKWEAEVIRFNSALGRIESFGDVDSVMMAMNYIRIVRGNPQTKFGVWTKNPGYWSEAIRILGKPRNLSVVYSSVLLNRPANPETVKRVFPFVDHIFTVYTKEYAKEHPELEINCGALHCASCQRCYKQRKRIDVVSEVLK